MKVVTRTTLSITLFHLSLVGLLCFTAHAAAGPPKTDFWQVDEVKAGMKGEGKTVIKGMKIEPFQAEVLGVMKNTSPGRDMILCKLSGANLEKTGVIAGMSGSPVYINGKLLGAVAYAWSYGKEPIAGITPFCQMHDYAESFEQKDLAEKSKPRQIGLFQPIYIDGKNYNKVTVTDSFEAPQPTAADGLFMMPLQTPLAGTGFTPRSLSLLKDRFQNMGMVPMQGGGVSAAVADKAMGTPLEPGGALTVALVLGDFDLSGIGTVTHIEGKRVYGWGHPFMGLGECDFPLMTGYVHTIYPRQTISFKMGSPLRTVGVINADVSTCIAGWLERKPDMMPVSMLVKRDAYSPTKNFNVQVVRQKSLMPTLVLTSLSNSVDMEGELPAEMTTELKARIEIEGHAPIVIEDTFSGFSYSGSRAPRNLYSQIGAVLQSLTQHDFAPVQIKKVECTTYIKDGQRTAQIEGVQLDSKVYQPGETVKATVFLKPHKSATESVIVSLKLPADLPVGEYQAKVLEDGANTRAQIQDDPNLNNPQNLNHLLAALKIQTAAKRTNVVLRVPLEGIGVALKGKSLPNLPPSMVHILSNNKVSGGQSLSGALSAKLTTEWVISGSESVQFRVVKNKHGIHVN